MSKAGASSRTIHNAIDAGIRSYFSQSRTHVATFIDENYRYPGCWHTHRVAFGWDLLRSPLNLFWAPAYLFIQLLTLLFVRFSLPLSVYLEKLSLWLPVGFTTNVQKKLNARILDELLSFQGVEKSIVSHVSEALPESSDIKGRDVQKKLDVVVKNALDELMNARTATGDITNTLMMTLVGVGVFKKFTPGGVGVGMLLAALWVEHQAKTQFFLGESVGAWYYTLFPPQPSLAQTSLFVVLVMIALAILASFSGLLTDPILAVFGFHRRRLHRLINHVEGALLKNHERNFKTLDPYVARILEIFDSIKSSLPI